MSKEGSTYFTYNAAVEAKHLHLGNLVHDYKNPNDYDPYEEKAYTDIEEPPPAWAKKDALENYALTLGKTTADEGDEDEPGSQRYRVAAAAKTTKLEIIDPEKFFKEHTLASPSAKKWFSSHLSAAESIAKGKPGPRPEVWMLTGLILMQHATWTLLSSKDKSFTAGKQAPFIPAGVSAIRRSSVSDHVKPTFGYTASEEGKNIPGGHVIHETGKYPGTRGWAARWQKVEVDVLPGEKWKDGVKNLLRLKQFSEDPSKIAVVELDADDYAENLDNEEGEDEDEFDEDYWDAFIDAIEE